MPDQQRYTQKLKDAHVLVIGGSAGIGFGVAEAALEHGAHVIISSSQESRVQDAISRLKKAYPSAADKIAGYPCNLADEATLESNIESLFDKCGTVDHIVYTAGDKLATIPPSEVSMGRVKQAGMVRFFAPLMVAKHGSKHISPGPRSSITLTTGSVSERPLPNWTVVGAYASGLHAMTRGLALDLKPVRVNLVSPGGVDTELWGDMPEEKKQDMFKEFGKKMATGTIGQVEDVAEAFIYAMKDRNLTGSMISTNGGALLM